MNIESRYSLGGIISELEAAFCIDGKDMFNLDILKLEGTIRSRISAQYQISLINYDISDPEMDVLDSRDNVALFVDNITRIHSKLCGYNQICRYLGKTDVSLSSVNYIGYESESLIKVLKCMAHIKYVPRVSSQIMALTEKVGTIEHSYERRLLTLLILAHNIGFPELAATIAEILYQAENREKRNNGYSNYK